VHVVPDALKTPKIPGIMKPAFLSLIGLLGLADGAAPLRAVEGVKPNIVFFLADDLGFMDIDANNPRAFYFYCILKF
jgi:hypothetical protein